MHLVIYYLATPPIIKLKLGVQQIGGGLLIANHVEPIIMIDQSEILSSSTRINLLHSFHGSQSCCGRLLPATTKTVQLCGAKTIFLIQTRIFFFDFSSTNRIVQDHHIVSTTGDALILCLLPWSI